MSELGPHQAQIYMNIFWLLDHIRHKYTWIWSQLRPTRHEYCYV